MFRFRSFEFFTDESFLPSLSHLFCSAVGCCCCRGEEMYGVSHVQQTVVQFRYSFPSFVSLIWMLGSVLTCMCVLWFWHYILKLKLELDTTGSDSYVTYQRQTNVCRCIVTLPATTAVSVGKIKSLLTQSNSQSKQTETSERTDPGV